MKPSPLPLPFSNAKHTSFVYKMVGELASSRFGFALGARAKIKVVSRGDNILFFPRKNQSKKKGKLSITISLR